MPGFFQKTTTAGNGVPRIKHSSDYTGTSDSAALQAAFDDLQPGDTLFINRDYTLETTVNIIPNISGRTGSIDVIGTGGLIQPQSNNSLSPLISLRTRPNVPVLGNVKISGLRFRNANGVNPPTGSGVALEI